MSTDSIIPHSELMRRAADWALDEKREHPDRNENALADEAGMRFNLSPHDSELLLSFLHNLKPEKSVES